jgi:GNAT superfamily N-acetyltransferase
MIAVTAAEDDRALAEFAAFPRRVYAAQGLRAPAAPAETLALVRHETPFTEGRRFRPFLAREGGRAVARAAALVDDRYNAHWNERLGYLALFEAAAGAVAASRALIDQAGDWLASQGCRVIRAGYGSFEPGFVIDDYAHVLRRLWRHNLPYYHAFLKQAGFEMEKGSAEYVIRASAALASRYREYADGARAAGYEIVPLRRLPRERCIADFTATWNAAYTDHWGLAPMRERELATLLDHHERSPTMDLSAIAYRGAEPVGVVLVQESPGQRSFMRRAVRRPSSRIEGLSNFAVGVAPAARGAGLAPALAAHAYLQLIARGAQAFSYGMVIDDNRASRRTAEKLGASVCANYVTYRRSLGG